MDLNKIKLIIWDLDETFWKGTISEEEVEIVDEHCKFIKHLTNRGIMNSICSKNDFDQVRSRLESDGLWDYFVFPSIDWTPKGKRIADIITKMSLRPVNVLFIDDNPMNLNEAKYYLPDLNVMHIDNIEEIIDEADSVGKDDRQHKRLKQYHQLEKKVEASSHFESTDEFLLQSEITVTIENDCAQRLGRIHEMVERTNQLNFTKLRSSMEELRNTVENPSMECGVVSAKDKYGDYGVVGFYALDREKNSLLHFLFSCRTMGMGIEQYVYEMLHFPALEIHGDVSATLERVQKVHWIKQSKGKGSSSSKEETCLNDKDICRILLKGPCDMDSVLPYLGKNSGCKLETEFNYVDSRGVAITAMNHTEMIKAADTLTDYEQNMLLRDAPFLDAGVFKTKLKGGDYDIVFMSLLPDSHEGVYRHKESGLMIPFSSFNYDFTDERNWDGIINGDITNHNYRFSKSYLAEFRNKFDFIGSLPPHRIVENVRYIRDKISDPSTKLVLILGSEIECESPSSDEFIKHGSRHQEVNDALRAAFSDHKGIGFINITDFISSQADFKGATNHFSRNVYYKLACSISSAVGECAGTVKVNVSNPLVVGLKGLLGKVKRKLKK